MLNKILFLDFIKFSSLLLIALDLLFKLYAFLFVMLALTKFFKISEENCTNYDYYSMYLGISQAWPVN